MQDSGVPYDRFVALESASNSCPSNVDYRAWWFQQVAEHCQTSMIYQDNPPYGYFDQPAVGYGYVRDDGLRESTCATWNARQFMRRALHVALASGTDNPAPGVYPNVCGSAQPGRSFCFRGLNGEYLESDRLPLGTLRVWCSPQWGMNLNWLMQEPNAGATLKYWRALCSRLFLLNVTSFSREDSANQAACWQRALDLFWLDDPTLVWHPYFRRPVVKATLRPTTLVSAYTARGRVLLIVSNQGADEVVESVTLKDLAPWGPAGCAISTTPRAARRSRRPRTAVSASICPAATIAWCWDFRGCGPLRRKTCWTLAASGRNRRSTRGGPSPPCAANSSPRRGYRRSRTGIA